VAAGGALGALARHGLNHLVHTRWPLLRFPAATLAVNVIGCFAIGYVAGLLAAHRVEIRFAWREFIVVGLLGGFTTFSSFGLDTLTLARGGAPGAAVLNVALHVCLGLAAAYGGFGVGRG
jgi:CrcB protein